MPDLLERAVEAARAGGTVLRDRLGTIEHVRTKSTASDLVTEVDVASGIAVVRSLAQAMPGARFVVEEPEVCDLAGVRAGTLADDEVWVIDPLDGTTSYVHGYPCYSVSVALLRGGQPFVGAVYDVARDQMNAAAKGRGSTRDGRSLAVSGAAADLGRALVVTGFPYDRGLTLDRQLSVLGYMLRRIQGMRRDGSAAIDCCHVASGAADGFWEFELKTWDTAAGALIAMEAGAVVTDFCGRPWSVDTRDTLVANPALHAVMLEAIATALTEAGLPTPS
jgi:myo-inositol-1(or 4)-monophosphatase